MAGPPSPQVLVGAAQAVPLPATVVIVPPTVNSRTRLSPESATQTFPRLSTNTLKADEMGAEVAGPPSPQAELPVGFGHATPVPATVEITPGVSAACGPVPVPVSGKLMEPVLVTTCSGAGRAPGYAGVKVMGIVQVTPLALLPPTTHPVTVPTVYSCLPPAESGTLMLVMVSAAVVVSRTFCTALVSSTAVAGKFPNPTLRTRLSTRSPT